MARAPKFAFPEDMLAFLDELRHHNDKAWFDANRDRYEQSYLEPAKAFITAIGPALDDLVPGIHAEPRVLGSIFRINRDTRFSKDKRPYKDHLDLWFWEGDRKAAVSGLFLRVKADEVVVGAGVHGFDKDQLARYRAAVADPTAGGELVKLVTRLEKAGNDVGAETYMRTPRGFEATGRAEALLRHSSLYVHRIEPAALATQDTFAAEMLERWKSYLPLHAWIVSNVADGTPSARAHRG